MKHCLFILALTCSCASLDHVVESDYSYDGNFKRYQSYDFAENIGLTSNLMESTLIENHISQTLDNWGYKKSSTKPDLIVFYKIYSSDLDLIGFDQPDFQHWISTNHPRLNFVDSAMLNSTKKNFTETYDKSALHMKNGTIQITFVDRKRKAVIWNGYSSGYSENIVTTNRYDFKTIINRVLYEYRLLARNQD